MNHSLSQETMNEQQAPGPENDSHGSTVFSEEARRNGESRSRRGLQSNSGTTPRQIQWVGRVMALLVILCFILAAWVWAGILCDVP